MLFKSFHWLSHLGILAIMPCSTNMESVRVAFGGTILAFYILGAFSITTRTCCVWDNYSQLGVTSLGYYLPSHTAVSKKVVLQRGKAYATISKVIMGNVCFYSCFSEPQGVLAWWKETAQTRIRFFSFLVAESPWTSIKQSQILTTHNANRHCCIRFYTFAGQPLSRQLYPTRVRGVVAKY